MIFKFLPIPRTPSSMMIPRTPGSNDGRRNFFRENFFSTISNFFKNILQLFHQFPSDTSIGQKSHDIFHFFTLRQKIENLKFWKWIFWISNGRNYRDPEAPLAVVLRGDTTTRGATSEMLITCMSKTLVNAMFFGVKRLPPGDPCCAQSTAVDNSQRNVDSSLIKTLANAMFFRVRRLPPGGLFSKLRIVDFLLE